MNIVITMAGLGARFMQAGYTVPKYMIEAHGKSLFAWALSSLSGLTTPDAQYIFIVRSGDGVVPFIAEQCGLLQLTHYQIIEINYLTDGQATTAMLAARYWRAEEPLLVYNIDTFVEPEEMQFAQLCGDGFIPCFSAPGSHWSFVRLDASGKAVEVREKQRISDHCTVGAYYFHSCLLYARLYTTYYDRPSASERYIAPLYNYLIAEGGHVYISSIPAEKVHVLGTPEELEVFRRTYAAGITIARPAVS